MNSVGNFIILDIYHYQLFPFSLVYYAEFLSMDLEVIDQRELVQNKYLFMTSEAIISSL